MTLKDFVIAHVKPEDYYALRFPQWNPRVRSNVSCPFHEDGVRPNLAIALNNGGARCHSSQCAKRIGNIVHFEAELKGIKEPLAARRLYRRFVRPVVDKETLVEYRTNLSNDAAYILRIRREMGLSLRGIKRFQLGLDVSNHRITIPVYDPWGQCVNIRFYRLPSERTQKDEAKLYNLKGFGGTDLFPWPAVEAFDVSAPIFIMASEKEAMLAIEDGYNAFASTSGEDKWDASWIPVVKDRDVFLVYDTDAGGDGARKRVLPLVEPHCRSVHSIILPWKTQRKDRTDYADWRLREHHEAPELGRLARRLARKNKARTDDVRGSSKTVDEATDADVPRRLDLPEVPELHSKRLFQIADLSSRADLLNKLIRTQGIVAAKSPNTYSIPWKFKVKIKNRAMFEYQLPMGRELLRFIRASDTQILQSLQTLLGNNNAEIEPIAYLTASEVEIIPTAVADSDEAKYITQRCFYFGDRIEANIPYYLEIIPTSEIRSQETIGCITRIEPLSRSIERFDFTPENIADLSFFQPTEGEDVWDKLEHTANYIAHKFTRIYNRLDWHLCALLTWASPIRWRFPSETKYERGWLNTLAVGDTETGKSRVALALQALFNCGVFVSGENCTFVGLVGGAVKMGSDKLMLRWGRIPLSDRQLVVLEELSGLSVDEISNMSDVRSSGIARLDKGGINSETNSRTRLLCLSNARSTKKSLSQYLFGIHAVQELIGHGEDIARFDLITTLTDREVSIDVINSNHFATAANQLDFPFAKDIEVDIASDQFQKLIHFIWALGPDQVKFSVDAYEECLEETKRLASKYHPSIPVFKGGSGRYKLGRIAAAIACFQFAWDGACVQVSPEHVNAAARLLELIYTKPSFGYAEYSRQMFDREKVKDTGLLRRTFKRQILSRETLSKVIETLIHSTRFTRDELCAIAGITIMHADQLLGVMVRERAIRKGEANVWDITPAGKAFFEEFIERLS